MTNKFPKPFPVPVESDRTMHREKQYCASFTLVALVIGLAAFGYITPALRPARFFAYTGTVASRAVQQDAWLRCNVAASFVVAPMRTILPADASVVQQTSAALKAGDAGSSSAKHVVLGRSFDYVQYVPRLLWRNQSFYISDTTMSGDLQTARLPTEHCSGKAFIFSTWGEGSIADFSWRLMVLYQFLQDFAQAADGASSADASAIFGDIEVIVWSDFGQWERSLMAIVFPHQVNAELVLLLPVPCRACIVLLWAK